jgi:hypothetical protein
MQTASCSETRVVGLMGRAGIRRGASAFRTPRGAAVPLAEAGIEPLGVRRAWVYVPARSHATYGLVSADRGG